MFITFASGALATQECSNAARAAVLETLAPRGGGKFRACFVAGTLVLTADGLRPIEQVEVGEMVACADTTSGDWTFCAVVETLQHFHTGVLVAVVVDDSTIVGTGNHPFWVAEADGLGTRPLAVDAGADALLVSERGRWVQASDLRAGDIVLLANGEKSFVTSVSQSSNDVAVFNLRVADYQTYAVGEAAVLVHNKASVNRLVEFTKDMASNSKTIAQGSKIRKVRGIVSEFGGKAKRWSKKKTWDASGQEWHYYEHPGIGRVGMKRAGDVDPF